MNSIERNAWRRGVTEMDRAPLRDKRERIERLRRRVADAITTDQLRAAVKGILDLLADEL
jgi:hypothetical protein